MERHFFYPCHRNQSAAVAAAEEEGRYQIQIPGEKEERRRGPKKEEVERGGNQLLPISITSFRLLLLSSFFPPLRLSLSPVFLPHLAKVWVSTNEFAFVC